MGRNKKNSFGRFLFSLPLEVTKELASIPFAGKKKKKSSPGNTINVVVERHHHHHYWHKPEVKK